MIGTLTFDAGALIALDRNDRQAWARLRGLARRRQRPTVPAVVIAQAWRSARQANLSRALALCTVEAVDEELARAAGVLCGQAGTSDVVDAIVVASAARRRGAVVTSDTDDITRLAAHVRGVSVMAI